MPIDGLKFRRLTHDDIEGAVALSTEAGWNQVAADWHYMLAAGIGTAVEADDGQIVATSMVLPYGGRFAWIAMILVTRRWRRRGLATRLMTRALDTCSDRGLVAGLDATELGAPVYRPLGFVDIYRLTRWAADRVSDVVVPDGISVSPISREDLPEIVRLDRRISGADRAQLLEHLYTRARHLAYKATEAGRVTGYLFGRNGRVATQLGPLAAEGPPTALALLATGLGCVGEPIFLDLLDAHRDIDAWLQVHGFEQQRGYTRMLLNVYVPFDEARANVLIAGPEFG